MNGLIRYLRYAALAALLLTGCSDKNSTEACIHQVSLDLDHGNYDAVLGASCADSMQKGAAYFGKAGFDVKNVINKFSQLGSTDTSTQTTSDLQTYLTGLIPNVTPDVLDNLGLAKESYCSSFGGTVDAGSQCTVADPAAAAGNANYYDANFYISLVDTVTTLSLVKSAVGSVGATGGDIGLDCSSGTCVATCDRNSNSVPDYADAESCTLLLASGLSSCSTLTGVSIAQQIKNLTIAKADGTGNYSGLYDGVIVSVTGNGTSTSCSSATTYNRLMYASGGAEFAAATTSDVCRESPDTGREWPCPMTDSSGNPVDFVSSIDDVLNSAVNALNASLTSASTGTNDVVQSIQDVKSEACCGCDTSVQTCGVCTSPCTATSLFNYLQNNLSTK